MNRRDWLRWAGSFAGMGLAGCGSSAPATSISQSTKRRLGSGGVSGYGIWQGGRALENASLGSRPGSLSLTKSLAALAVVRAAGEGWLPLDGTLTDVIPEWRGDAAKSRITPRMLTNMTAGFDPGAGTLYRNKHPDKGKAAINLPLLDAPGTRFRYGPACWEVLGEVLHRKLSAQGSTVEKYIQRVMRRVGLSTPDWRADGAGHYYLSTGARFSVRDLGKYGRVLGRLASGENDAGLDALIFRDLASPRMANPMFGAGIWWNRNGGRNGASAIEPERVLDGARDPGFWNRACLSTSADPGWFALVGSGGKRVYVLPSRELVIVRMGTAYGWNDGAFLDTVSV